MLMVNLFSPNGQIMHPGRSVVEHPWYSLLYIVLPGARQIVDKDVTFVKFFSLESCLSCLTCIDLFVSIIL